MRPLTGLFPFSLSLCLLAAACTPAKMQVPADLTVQAEVIPVTQRSRMTGALANESFTLGPYAVGNVDRKWNSSQSLSIGTWSSGNTVGGYTFTFTSPEGTAQGRCATEAGSKAITLGGGFAVENEMAKLGCSCRGSAASSWVVLDSPEQREYLGTVQTRAGQSEMRSIHTMQGTSLRNTAPMGYELRAQHTIAAIEVAHPGRAWFSTLLDPAARADIACLFAGLLLYQPPRD